MERAQTLQIDTESLRRRLGIVQAEIDRVKKDHAVAMQKFEALSLSNNAIQQKILQKEPMDIDN